MHIPTQGGVTAQPQPQDHTASWQGHPGRPVLHTQPLCLLSGSGLPGEDVRHIELSPGGRNGDCEKLARPHWKCHRQMTQDLSELSEASLVPQAVKLLGQQPPSSVSGSTVPHLLRTEPGSIADSILLHVLVPPTRGSCQHLSL